MEITKAAVFTALLSLGGVNAAKYSKYDQLDKYEFADYLKESGKQYSDPSEYSRRAAIFNVNIEIIRSHNLKKSSYKMGVNKYTDQTTEEMESYAFGGKKQLLNVASKGESLLMRNPRKEDLPGSVDWREHSPNIISPVKDQGSCGSCWAFAAAATIEAHVALNTGFLGEVSTQELVSCMSNDDECGGTGGCGGATAELAFDYLTANGLSELWAYGYLPTTYRSGVDNNCLRDERMPLAAHGTGYTLLSRNDYDEVMYAIANVGPLAVNVDASAWSKYESGVFSGCPQEDVTINHVVQLVGYGTDQIGGDYWLIRNSWSPDWGEAGYMKLARGAGYCGTDFHNGAGVGCNYDPRNVTVCGMCGILYDVSYPTGVTI